MERVTDGRVGKEKNRPLETVIKTKDVRCTAWIRVKQWPSWRDRKRRRRRGRKWKEREISAASAQPHSDGWSLEPAILNPLEGHFFTFPYKSPDKLFTSCSSTQHDICEQAFVCLLRPAFDKPHCTDLQYAPICGEWPLQTTLYIIALLVFEVFHTAKLVSAKKTQLFFLQ